MLRPVIVCLIAGWASGVWGQQSAPQLGSSPLGIRQQRVQRMVEDLEKRFKSLKLALSKDEPDRAERLQQTLNKAKELLIQERMGDVARLLDEANLDPAENSQRALIADIQSLMALLLDEKADRANVREEYKQLNEWRRELERLVEAEREEKRKTEEFLNMGRAPAELKNEPRIAALTPEVFNRLARQQNEIASQAAKLGKRMQPQSPSEKSGQVVNENGFGKQRQAQVARAQELMHQAAGRLRKQDAADASRQEARAIKELEQALAEIEDRLNELREATEMEKLAHLEVHFREMLTTQLRLTSQTAALEKKRVGAGGQLTRSDRNAVRAIGDEERRIEAVKSDTQPKEAGLAGKAQQALDILGEEGKSVVFMDIVTQLREDLESCGNLLVESLQTDASTAALQQEIETTLEELAAALQQAQQRREASEGEEGGEGRGNGQQPLLPNSAELKLLRSAQLRINRRTAALNESKPTTAKLDDRLKVEARKLTVRQAEIAEMAARILEREP